MLMLAKTALQRAQGAAAASGITFVNSATASDNTSGATYTLTLPGGLVQNDIVVVINFDTEDSTPPGVPSGYTNIRTQSGGSVSFRAAYKFMSSSPDSSITLERTSTPFVYPSVAIAFIFRGVNTITPLDVSATGDDSFTGAPDAPAITPTSNNCCIIAGGALRDPSTTVGTPLNYSVPVTVASSGAAVDVVATACYRVLIGGAAVSEDPAPFTGWSPGSKDWATFTIALRPVP
jgi:hypothetical protein